MASINLPADLAGPVAVQLARAQEDVPSEHAMPGGSVYELKWDGFRCVLVRGASVRLWSRQGKDLTASFPDVAAAAQRLPAGLVIDGELVIWNGTRLDFDLLQRRLTAGRTQLGEHAARHPVSLMVFDLLATEGIDRRPLPWSQRRALLEEVDSWAPPLQLSPTTTDRALASAWMVGHAAAGVEGLVVKGAASPYLPGRRAWVKVKTRTTHEVIVGAVIGPRTSPTALIGGLYRRGELVMVGRTVALSTGQSKTIAALLEDAGADHPWPDTVPANRFGGSRDRVQLTKVAPTVVVEVSGDTARQDGVWRHALRLMRPRADLNPSDLEPLT